MGRGRRRTESPLPNPGAPTPRSTNAVMSRPRSRGRLLVFAGLALLILAGLGWWTLTPSTPLPRPRAELRGAQEALRRREFATAERLANETLERDPRSIEAILVAAQAAAGQQQIDRALDRLRLLPEDPQSLENPEVRAARLLGGTLLQTAGRFAEADAWWRRILATDRSASVLTEYAKLLCWSGRFTDGRVVLAETLAEPSLPVQHLLWAARPEVVLDPRVTASLEGWRKAFPRDPLLPLGIGASAELHGDTAVAERAFRDVLAIDPSNVEARLRLGGRILERSPKEWDRWLEEIPDETRVLCRRRSEFWSQVARRAATIGSDETALAASLQALVIDSLDREAAYQSGLLAGRLRLAELAERCRSRAVRLDNLKTRVDRVIDQSGGTRALAEDLLAVSREYRDLGRPAEALAWYRQAAYRDGRVIEPSRDLFDELTRALERGAAEQKAVTSDDLRAVFALLPVPSEGTADQQWLLAILRNEPPSARPIEPTTKPSSTLEPVAAAGVISFREEAADRGIRFRYHNAHDPSQVAMRMQEFTGGGVAWLDYDCDGALDLFAAQGTDWPVDRSRPADSGRPSTVDPSRQDALFRQRGETFSDVAPLALPGEGGFGQGVAAGEFNEDGFPDLYVANIGQDRLWRNLGDGTFEDVTAEAGIAEEAWSTSACLADLTGDGLTDIYVANYAEGATVFTEICRDSAGVPRSCKPTIFAAAPDRFYVNQGDGTYREESALRGLTGENGRGLGVVAWDADDTGRLSLFVANDGTANFVFLPVESAGSGGAQAGTVTFRESALETGLAFDEYGKPQACMGVAAGDADGDGRIDLFVTNYFRESNTLYAAQGAGAFRDATRETGLREPSLQQLGFGSQFLDADLDGWEDLLVTNGHEGDYRDLGIPFAMPPQVFRNESGRGAKPGRFSEIPRAAAGPYFEKDYLGRGLAVGDWNGDGRVDAAITHLDAPLALLTNTSSPSERPLTVRLKGTRLPRDPIGTRVTLFPSKDAMAPTRTRQLTAGDGYLASNDRALILAAGDGSPRRMTVSWPGGQVAGLAEVPAGKEIMVVEGVAGFFPLPDRRTTSRDLGR